MPVSLDLQHCMEGHGIHNRFHVIYNLVNTDTFKLGTPHHDGKKQILHISTLRDEAKNFSGILRVVEKLWQQRQDFELHVIHDYKAPEFKAFVKDHNLSDCVIFHGKKTSEEVAKAYQEADFFVLFSNFENLPCVIVEAFASGVPVLSSAVGGIAEILSPERGILIPSGDEEALLQGMNTMLDHSQDYDRQAIRDYAIKTFSAEKIGEAILQQYSS
jgi:glycosyltransferase involved in cell wall biosynthesis